MKARFAQLNQEKQQYLSEKKTIDAHFAEVDRLAEKDPVAAVQKAIELRGGDPKAFMDKLFTNIKEEVEKIQGMTPEEVRAYQAEKKANMLEQSVKQQEEQRRVTQQNAEINTKISELCGTHEIDDGTFDSVAEELLNLHENGKINQKITPDLVVEVILDDRRYEMAGEILGSIDKTLAGDKAIQDELVRIARNNPDYTKDDLQQIAIQAFGDQGDKEELSEKLSKSNSKVTERKPIQPQNEDPWNFDQL